VRGLVVDVDEALFAEDTRKELRGRNRPDGRGVERVIERQALNGTTEMHLDRGRYRHREPAVEDEVSEFGFVVDLLWTGCGHLDVENALIGGFGDHRTPDVEQAMRMLIHFDGRVIVDLVSDAVRRLHKCELPLIDVLSAR
jgi:hypothetical protein